MSPRRRFVVVGNGVAGMEAALRLRAREPDAELTIVSEESDHHFSRPALMWINAGQLSHRDTEPYPRDHYERLRIRRVRARATGFDARDKALHVVGEAPLAYDRLLIACGSRPRPAPWPGGDLVGVGHFVTHQDLAWFEDELFGAPNRAPPPNADGHAARSTPDSPYRRRASAAAIRGRPSRSPAIVGGGLIGLEVVELALARGLRPTFFLRDEWFWPMALDATESRFLEARMRAHGVIVHRDARVDALRGGADGCIEAVEVAGVPHAADCAVVAIGVQPNTGWLEGSPIARDATGAIEVDDSARTSLADVFAAGDCAAVPQADGSRRTELLWYTARDQGRSAADAMCGDSARYSRGIPYNTAKMMDVEYATVGVVQDGVPDERTWSFEERGAIGSTTRIVLSGDRVVGFNLLGRRWDLGVLRDFVASGRSLDYVLDHLRDAAFDTELVPGLVVPRDAREKAPSPTRRGRPLAEAEG